MSVSAFKSSAYPTQDLEKRMCTLTVGNPAKGTAVTAVHLGSRNRGCQHASEARNPIWSLAPKYCVSYVLHFRARLSLRVTDQTNQLNALSMRVLAH